MTQKNRSSFIFKVLVLRKVIWASLRAAESLNLWGCWLSTLLLLETEPLTLTEQLVLLVPQQTCQQCVFSWIFLCFWPHLKKRSFSFVSPEVVLVLAGHQTGNYFPGAPVNISQDDADLCKVIGNATNLYNKQSDDAFLFRASSIIRAQRQVGPPPVSPVLTIFTHRLSVSDR